MKTTVNNTIDESRRKNNEKIVSSYLSPLYRAHFSKLSIELDADFSVIRFPSPKSRADFPISPRARQSAPESADREENIVIR